MKIRRARQILRSFADDTRLRIINLLGKEELNVSELCEILGCAQSNLSKHLARLRLTGIVSDRRQGFNVYYYLRKPENKAHRELVNTIVRGLSDLKIFGKDLRRLGKMRKKVK